MSEEIVRRILTNRKKIIFESTNVAMPEETVKESLVYELEDTVRNGGYVWQVKAIKGNYILFHAPMKKKENYVVATGMRELGSGRNMQTTWNNEKYFSDPRKAYKYLLTKAGKLTVNDEDDQYLSESEEVSVTKTCECGSTNIIVENGEEICDECGRRYFSTNEMSEPLLPKKSLEEAEKYTQKEVLIAALKYWNEGKYEKAMQTCKKYGVSEKTFINLLVHSYRESEEVEGEDIEENFDIVKPDSKVNGNIIRAIQKPMSTKDKPNISDAVTSAE